MQLGSAISPDLPVTSGTIQGSVVGPVLWSLFINQLAKRLRVPSVLFADDFKCLFNLQVISKEEAQAEIDLFCAWCFENHVLINTDKSCCLHSSVNNNTQYKCDNMPISNVSSFKDLSVIRSAKGGYELHSEYAVCKAKRVAATILKNLVIPNYSIGWRLFQTYVQPTLLYGSIAWNPLNRGACTIIESIQRKYTKRLPGLSSSTYEQRLRAIHARSSEATRIYNDLAFAYKVIHGLVPFEISDFGFQISAHSRAPLFIMPLVKKEHVRQFAQFRIPAQWNLLPSTIRSASTFYTFKNLLQNWLLTHDPAFI